MEHSDLEGTGMFTLESDLVRRGGGDTYKRNIPHKMTSSTEFELLVPPINTPSRYFFKLAFERKQNELRVKTLKKRKTLLCSK